jgi:stress-induced morphogen
MSHHETDFKGDILAAIREAIEARMPGAVARVAGGGGHYTIDVSSPSFAGKSRLESQRLVYSAIAHLMKGDSAPVHAVDRLDTRTPG